MDTSSIDFLLTTFSEGYFPRLLTNIVGGCALIYGVYLPNNNRKREYLFTFLMFNLVIFHIAYLLNKTELSLGAAFGLFAVFGLLRYRTEEMPMKEMTYLFVSIALGLVTAVARGYAEAAGVSFILLVATFLLDSGLISRKELHKDIRYEQIEMIRPENHEGLLQDLRHRTGLDIHYITIQNIDFVRDAADLRIFYHEHQASTAAKSKAAFNEKTTPLFKEKSEGKASLRPDGVRIN
jgi:hypothetical protein